MTFDPFGDFNTRGYLQNSLGLKDPEKVKEWENASFQTGLDKAVDTLSKVETITYDDIKEVHQTLFEPAYPTWAGKDRGVVAPDIAIVKGGHTDLFAHPADTKRAGDYALRGQENMAAKPGQAYADLAYAHPFLDGNGRTILVVHSEMMRRAGLHVNWAQTEKSEFLKALTAELQSPGKGKFDEYLAPYVKEGSLTVEQTAQQLSTLFEEQQITKDTPSLGLERPFDGTSQLKGEIAEDILQSFDSVKKGTAPIESLRETVTSAYQSSIDNGINDFAFYGPNAPKALGAAAALNPNLTMELMTAQAAVDTINQVQPALRADKPKDITPEQMQNLKTSAQNNVYGNAFLTAAARVSPTFMRFYIQTQTLVSLLVPSVKTDQRLSDEQIDTSLMNESGLKKSAGRLQESIEAIYQKPEEAFKKATELASDPRISPSDLRNDIANKPEILGELKPIKKGMFGRTDERATSRAVCEVKNDAEALSKSLQHGRKEARKIETKVSKTLEKGVDLPSPELSEGLHKFEQNPELKNFGKGYDVEKLYTQGQNILDKTGDVVRLSGKRGFGMKPETLENVKKLQSTVQKLEQKSLNLTKALKPKLGPQI